MIVDAWRDAAARTQKAYDAWHGCRENSKRAGLCHAYRDALREEEQAAGWLAEAAVAKPGRAA